MLITCNLGAGPGASLVGGGDGGLVVGVCGVGGGVGGGAGGDGGLVVGDGGLVVGVCGLGGGFGGDGGDGGLGGGDAHRSGAGGELQAIGAAVAAWVQWAAFH